MDEQTLENLAQQLGQCLQQRQLVLATAESCTGGWVATTLTAVSGSSRWFDRGFVTYSNEAKQEMLSVPAEILQQHGAVSQATVEAMTRGALQHSRAQVAVAISGVAGPGGGSAERPVGTVWLAWAWPDHQYSQCFQFDGDRRAVRWQSVQQALQGLIQGLG